MVGFLECLVRLLWALFCVEADVGAISTSEGRVFGVVCDFSRRSYHLAGCTLLAGRIFLVCLCGRLVVCVQCSLAPWALCKSPMLRKLRWSVLHCVCCGSWWLLWSCSRLFSVTADWYSGFSYLALYFSHSSVFVLACIFSFSSILCDVYCKAKW